MKTIEQDQPESSKFSSSRNSSSSSAAASIPLFSFPIPSTKEFLAGGAGGLGQVLAGHPLDTIKVRLQVQGAAATANQAHFKGPIDCLVQTVRHEGFLGLYKGMAAPLCGVAFVNAVLFSAYGWAKDRIAASTVDTASSLSLSQIAVAGSFAGFVNSFVASPIELIKIRLQAQRSLQPHSPSSYSGPLDVARKLVEKEGVARGLFRGLGVTIVKEIPAYAGFYAGFEAAKRHFAASSRDGQTVSVPQLMMAGSIGGISYWVCCYPIDMVKSRIQQNSALPTGILRNARMMWNEGGVSAFFRGFGVSLARSVPSAAATFTFYELAMQYL